MRFRLVPTDDAFFRLFTPLWVVLSAHTVAIESWLDAWSRRRL